METYKLGELKPTITRPKISIYEYAGVCSQLAERFMNIKDLNDFVEEPQINNMIDPCQLGFKLLKNNKIDVQMDRCGYESVLFSQCQPNEHIEEEIENYINSINQSRKINFIDRIFDNQ